jgi:hypothetical protein
VFDETIHVSNNSNIEQLKSILLSSDSDSDNNDDDTEEPSAVPSQLPQPSTATVMDTDEPSTHTDKRAPSTVVEEGEWRAQPTPRAYTNDSVTGPRFRHDNVNLLTAVAGAIKGSDEPATMEEALSRSDADIWKHAMDDEIASHMENQTW